jgi:hypothetical protein
MDDINRQEEFTADELDIDSIKLIVNGDPFIVAGYLIDDKHYCNQDID